MPGTQSLRSNKWIAKRLAFPLYGGREPKIRTLYGNRKECSTHQITTLERLCYPPNSLFTPWWQTKSSLSSRLEMSADLFL